MKILNIDICLFCECRSFFFKFPADQACGSVCTTAVKKVLKKHEHVVALKSRNVYIHMFHYQVYAL